MYSTLYNEVIELGSQSATPQSNERLKHELARLVREFPEFKASLGRQLIAATETLQNAVDPHTVYRMQGQIKVIQHILESMATAKNS